MADKSNEQIYAPFSVRFAAFILDLVGGAIIFAISFSLSSIIFFPIWNDWDYVKRENYFLVSSIICLASTLFLYHIYSVYKYQATPGKYWLNLMVVNYEGNRVSLPAAFGPAHGLRI